MSSASNCCRSLGIVIYLPFSLFPLVAWVPYQSGCACVVINAQNIHILFKVCMEPLWNEGLSLHIPVSLREGKSSSSAVRIAAFSSRLDEVMDTPINMLSSGSSQKGAIVNLLL